MKQEIEEKVAKYISLMENLTYAEIADKIGISVATVCRVAKDYNVGRRRKLRLDIIELAIAEAEAEAENGQS